MPTAAEVCPLGDSACTLLTQTLKRCHDWQCVLDALERAGIDVSAQRTEFGNQQHLASTLKGAWFPNNP